ncbi:MAG TPA: hypothetical protein VIN75_22385 [Burkholderiaceae bacterium]
MKAWPILLGGAAACAACCAAPLAAGLAGGTSLLAAGSALFACAADVAPLAGLLTALGLAIAGATWWRRRARRRMACTPACKECGDGQRA